MKKHLSVLKIVSVAALLFCSSSSSFLKGEGKGFLDLGGDSTFGDFTRKSAFGCLKGTFTLGVTLAVIVGKGIEVGGGVGATGALTTILSAIGSNLATGDDWL